MKKKIGVLVAVCALALAAVAMAGCTSNEIYTPQGKDPVVTSPTIKQNGVLRVGVNTNNPPLAGQASKIVGIDVDLAAALADEMGLKLEIVDVGSDPAGAIAKDTVDIVMGVDKLSSDADMWKSDEYLPTSTVLFASTAGPVPTKDSNPKIGAQVSSMSAWIVTNQFGSSALTSSTDLKSAFASLVSGTVQYVAADAVIGTYAAYISDTPVVMVAQLSQPSGYCIAVSDKNTQLKQAVSTALKSLISGGVVKVVENKWLGTSIDLSNVPLTEGAKAATTQASDTEKKDGEEAKTDEAKTDEAKADEAKTEESGTASTEGSTAPAQQ